MLTPKSPGWSEDENETQDWILERRHDLITILKPHFLPKRLRFTRSYFKKAIDYSFYGFTGVITH